MSTMADLARRVIQVSADDVIGPGEMGSQDDDIVHATIWDPASTESWFGDVAPPQLGFGHFDKIARELKGDA